MFCFIFGKISMFETMLHPRKTRMSYYTPAYSYHLSTAATFFCPRCREVRLCKLMALLMSFLQVKSSLAAKERLEKTRGEDMERLSKQNKLREEKLAKLLQETETRHSEFTCNLSRSLSLLDHTNRGIAPYMDHTCS